MSDAGDVDWDGGKGDTGSGWVRGTVWTQGPPSSLMEKVGGGE